uniref:nitric-oxide synthase (NADPH) n=1 Tax=Physarum polycephalum TaxID=5791 RepID=A6XKZ5_PHYPO|nr:nitric oxide synthase form B [Physarum polycephalum]
MPSTAAHPPTNPTPATEISAPAQNPNPFHAPHPASSLSSGQCPFLNAFSTDTTHAHIPPHAHKGPLPIYMLTNNQKYTIPSEIAQRAISPDTKVSTSDCRERFCTAARMDMDYVITDISNPETVLREAKEWLTLFYKEKKLSDENLSIRMNEVYAEVKQTGTYFQTYDELSYACKVAWRNAPRCINRIQWSRMEVIDCRKVITAEEVFEKCLEHLKFATNGGNIITTVTVFAQQRVGHPPPRIWNTQLLRYAGYKQPDGSVIGDPSNIEMTEAAQKLGWVGQGTRFDVLPIVIQMPHEEAKWFSIPKEYILTVQISHPKYAWFEEMKMEWFGVPFVSNIGLTSGGVQYTCTPFNGWFMGTELSRNLGDIQRYNLLPEIATKLGVDPAGPPSSMWQEKANLELNAAILPSFQKSRVSIVDHHTAAAGFMNFWDAEHAAGRGVPADWVWLVPPCAGSASPLFHLEMANWLQKPAYFPMEFPGKNYNFPRQKRRSNVSLKGLARAGLILRKYATAAYDRRHRVRVLFATETGNSERYAQRLAKFLSAFAAVSVCNMESYDAKKLETEEVVICVASTFGEGDSPSCGIEFKEKLVNGKLNLKGVQFSVFGLGSTLYENFAAFGGFLDSRMEELGASRINPLAKGDEIVGSESTFKKWIGSLWKSLSTLWSFRQADYEHGLKILGIVRGTNNFVSTYTLEPAKPQAAQVKSGPPSSTYHRGNPYTATLIDNSELLKKTNGDRSTRKISLKVDTDVLKFNPGDHLGVLPENRPELVQELLDILRVKEPDAHFVLKPNGGESLSTPFTTLPFTIREAFTEHLDITSPPKPEFLEVFAHFAVHPGDKVKLQDLAKGTEEYENWVQHHQPTLPELFTLFPVSIPLELLLEKLPQMQTRFYSISSSPKMYPNEVHLTLGVLKYLTPSGKQHFGVASNFLANAKFGTKVKIFPRHADFSLPKDPATPIILVGPGTGLAPLRSFWQERAHLKDVGQAALFFGCRSHSEDFIYESEITNAKETGLLSHVSVAFSRDADKKVYVQDKLLEQADLVCEVLNNNGHIYVCGDATMACGVKETFKKIIQAKLAISEEESVKYMDELTKAKRYLTDVFGPALQTAKKS